MADPNPSQTDEIFAQSIAEQRARVWRVIWVTVFCVALILGGTYVYDTWFSPEAESISVEIPEVEIGLEDSQLL